MASSLPKTASASASVVTNPGLGPTRLGNSRVSFRLPQTPKLRLLAKGTQPNRGFSALVRAQLNEVAIDGPSNSSASPHTKLEVPSTEVKDPRPSNEPSALATEESVSEFIAQVTSLVKLVDSRDIVELQLKQLDCELLIRKKGALPRPPATAIMMHSPPPPPLMPVTTPAPPQMATSPPPSAPLPPPSASSPAASAKSSLPPLKCPMAGTIYRSPAPGEPPFVKVGDKVQKGQVLCIIEAMKLMNEIESLDLIGL